MTANWKTFEQIADGWTEISDRRISSIVGQIGFIDGARHRSGNSISPEAIELVERELLSRGYKRKITSHKPSPDQEPKILSSELLTWLVSGKIGVVQVRAQKSIDFGYGSKHFNVTFLVGPDGLHKLSGNEMYPDMMEQAAREKIDRENA